MATWLEKRIVPMGDLAAWHQYEPAVSGHHIIYDYSGNNRVILCNPANSPVLTANVLNGEPGWYFNGSRNPLAFSGTLTARHIFIVTAVDEIAFANYSGLLSGVTSGNILVGNPGSNRFFNFGLTAFGSFEYRKAGRVFAESNQQAPMSNNFKVIEIQFPPGIPLDGIQIGQQVNLTDRKFKGWFFEQMIYTQIKNAKERESVYQYLAMKFRLWEEYDDTRFIFPFPANRTRALERGKEHYLSEPYSGTEKALVRGNFKRAFELPFALRMQEEFDAAEAFHAAHHPITPFAIRDYNYYPERTRIVKTTSPIREQGSDVSHRFNYSFEVIEISEIQSQSTGNSVVFNGQTVNMDGDAVNFD